MNTQTFVQPFEFSALDLVRKTFQFSWANGGLFLWWYLPLVVVQLVIVWQGSPFADQLKISNHPFLWMGGLMVLHFLFYMASQLRVMRFTLLGERPNTYYVFELFRLRTWRLTLYCLWVSIQLLVVGGLAAILPIAFVQFVLVATPSFSGKLQFGWALGVQTAFVFLLGASLLVRRFMLFSPNIAIDGKPSLAQLGRRAVPVTRAVFRAFLLFYVAPLAAASLIMTVWIFSPSLRPLCNVLMAVGQVITPLINLLQVVAGSLVYIHLRPLLEREDPEPDALAAPAPAQP